MRRKHSMHTLLLLIVVAVAGGWIAINVSPSPQLQYTFAVGQLVDVVVVSPDGQYVAAAGSNEDKSQPQVYIWRVSDQEVVTTLPHGCYVMAMTVSPDSHHLAVAAGDGALVVVDLATGAVVHQLLAAQPNPVRSDHCHEPVETIDSRDIYSITIRPQGDLLAASRRDGIIQLFHLETGMLIGELQGHPSPYAANAYSQVWAVAFRADGQVLASAGADGAIHLWDVQARRLVQVLHPIGHDSNPYEVAFHPNGESLFVFRAIAQVERWTLADGKRIFQARLGKPPEGDVTFAPDGATVAVGGYARDMVSYSFFGPDTSIYLRSLTDLATLETLRGHWQRVSSLSFSANGQWLVSGSYDGTVRLWRVKE